MGIFLLHQLLHCCLQASLPKAKDRFAVVIIVINVYVSFIINAIVRKYEEYEDISALVS